MVDYSIHPLKENQILGWIGLTRHVIRLGIANLPIKTGVEIVITEGARQTGHQERGTTAICSAAC